MYINIEIELNLSDLTVEAIENAITQRINGYRWNDFMSFINELLRVTKARTYEVRKIEVK